jgi:SET domain-containing protein
VDVRVEECRIGRGVFAVRPFQAGEEILAITGPRVDIRTLDEAAWHALMDRGEPVQVGPYEYIEPDPPGRFLNHSCEPNAGLRPDLVVVALQAIPAGSQVEFDYSCCMQEDYWTMECLCGTASCRRVIEDFRCLPAALQQTYLAAGVVQAFIACQYAPAPVNG